MITQATPAAPASYAPSTIAESAAHRLHGAVAYLNRLLRDLNAGGAVVLVTDVHECPRGGAPLPQVRVEVRAPDAATSRPEVLDV